MTKVTFYLEQTKEIQGKRNLSFFCVILGLVYWMVYFCDLFLKKSYLIKSTLGKTLLIALNTWGQSSTLTKWLINKNL